MGKVRTDQQLVDDVLAGSLAAFDDLMKRYQRLVYSIAYGVVPSHQDALDITQNVFLKVYTRLDTYRADSLFKSWLGRITHNESVNWVRKTSRHQQDQEIQEHSVELDASQDEKVWQVEARSLIAGGMGQINPRYRLALTLRYFEGMSLKEVAEVLECSVGTVKNTLFRSVRQLRKALEEENPEAVNALVSELEA